MPSERRRLAVVIHDLNPWGGMERCTLEVARRLSHRWPVDVYAFTLQDPDPPGAWGDVRFHQVRPAIRRPAPLRSLWFYGATTRALRRAARGGALVHASGACALVSDVVQVHFVHAAWRARRTAPGGGASSIRGRARDAYRRAVTAFDEATERLTFGPRKTYVAVSRVVARELEEHYRLRAQVRVVHHGVDTARFHPAAGPDERQAVRRELAASPDDVVALFAGAYDRKGLACAIEAMALLPGPLRERIRLAAFGEGDRDAYLRLAGARGVAGHVVLRPHTKEIERVYRAADLFVFPTLYEPFGLVILEAMASGLAPITSRAAGASELIDHGRGGLLLDDPSDPRELASLLGRLAADDAGRARMGAAALAAAAARSWDRVAEEYAAVLAPLLDGAGGDGGFIAA